MGAITGFAEDQEWIAVEDASAPGHVRRAAAALAVRLGFSEHRAGEVAIAATELATNLQRHASKGVVLLRPQREAGEGALELFAIDSGPGMADMSVLSEDGISTRGTLGIGLGAVMRFATWFDAHSVPGRGTVIATTFLPSGAQAERPRVAGLTRPMNGEPVCGDAWAVRYEDGCAVLMLADGLGHGELAAIAAREAVRAFGSLAGESDLTRTMQHVEQALHGTRGAAVAFLKVDRAAASLNFVGVGNISTWVYEGDRRHMLVSNPGIVGSNPKRVREVVMPLPEDLVVVMHSDGLTSKWDIKNYPGVRARDPRILAATLLRDAGVHHDDASILVL